MYHVLEIGWFVDKGNEGKGLAYEAAEACIGFIFNELDAHRIFAKTSDNNTRSYRLAERLGFTKEGHLRENEIKDNVRNGTLLYGLLREEQDYRNASFWTRMSSSMSSSVLKK